MTKELSEILSIEDRKKKHEALVNWIQLVCGGHPYKVILPYKDTGHCHVNKELRVNYVAEGLIYLADNDTQMFGPAMMFRTMENINRDNYGTKEWFLKVKFQASDRPMHFTKWYELSFSTFDLLKEKFALFMETEKIPSLH